MSKAREGTFVAHIVEVELVIVKTKVYLDARQALGLTSCGGLCIAADGSQDKE